MLSCVLPLVALAAHLQVDCATLRARGVELERVRGGFSWEFIVAVVARESGFRPDAVSRSGAVGLFQFAPSTARELGYEPQVLRASVELQLDAGRRHFRKIHRMLARHAPELLRGGSGRDLSAVAYHAHHHGCFGTARILARLRAAGLPVRWETFRQMAPRHPRLSVAEEVAELAESVGRHRPAIEGRPNLPRGRRLK